MIATINFASSNAAGELGEWLQQLRYVVLSNLARTGGRLMKIERVGTMPPLPVWPSKWGITAIQKDEHTLCHKRRFLMNFIGLLGTPHMLLRVRVLQGLSSIPSHFRAAETEVL